MKKIIVLLVVMTFNLSFSQSDFKSGYYISNSGVKVEGFINDYKLDDNDFIYFKKDKSDKEIQIRIDDISELQIENTDKYLSRIVDYDVEYTKDFSSSTRKDTEPKIGKRQLLLKVLVEGDASLYAATINEVAFYYLKMTNSEALIYLIYNKSVYDNKVLNENTKFRRQLFDNIKCGTNSTYQKFYKIEYYGDELKNAVNDYNVCKSGTTIDLTKNEVKEKLRFSVFLGAKFNNISFENEYFYSQSFKESSTSPTIGIEMSYMLPLKKNTTELFFRASFDKAKISYEHQQQIPSSISTIYEQFDFSSNFLHFNLGPRFYLKNKSNNSVFIDASLEYTMLFSDETTFSSSVAFNTTNIKHANSNAALSFNLGIGYQFLKRYSIDVRYTTNNDYFSKPGEIEGQIVSKFSNVCATIRYKFN